MKILVGISGASGANLGLELVRALRDLGVDVRAILTDAAKISLKSEFGEINLAKFGAEFDGRNREMNSATQKADFDGQSSADLGLNSAVNSSRANRAVSQNSEMNSGEFDGQIWQKNSSQIQKMSGELNLSKRRGEFTPNTGEFKQNFGSQSGLNREMNSDKNTGATNGGANLAEFGAEFDGLFYSNDQIYAPPASGSSKFDAMIVAPCSLNSLAKIACGIGDSLLTRAAAVMLKERRKLILAVRETPLPTIALRQMSELSANGVIIAPPMMGFYSGASNLYEMKNFIIGKWLDCLGVENSLFARWE